MWHFPYNCLTAFVRCMLKLNFSASRIQSPRWFWMWFTKLVRANTSESMHFLKLQTEGVPTSRLNADILKISDPLLEPPARIPLCSFTTLCAFYSSFKNFPMYSTKYFFVLFYECVWGMTIPVFPGQLHYWCSFGKA